MPTVEQMYKKWAHRWPGDYPDVASFRSVYDRVVKIVTTRSREWIERRRMREADLRPVPRFLQDWAKDVGLYALKSNPYRNAGRVSGFQLRVLGEPKAVVTGRSYDLTYQDVMNYISKLEQRKEG